MNPKEINNKVKDEALKSIKSLLEESDGIQSNNLEYISKLVDIQKDLAEIEGGNNMRYRDYNEYNRYDDYNRYNNGYGYREVEGRGNYNRRGYDTKYRGHDHLDRMYEDYGRYMENRERYGNSNDTKQSLKYMLESMYDFAKMLKEEAQSQEEVEMIRQTAQKIASM